MATGLIRKKIEQVALLLLPAVGFPTAMAMPGIIEEGLQKITGWLAKGLVAHFR